METDLYNQRCIGCRVFICYDGGEETVSGPMCKRCLSPFFWGENKRLYHQQQQAIADAGQNALHKLPNESLEILGLERCDIGLGRIEIRPRKQSPTSG